MKCQSCGASLSGKSDICVYCGSLNDTDLHNINYATTCLPESSRYCPRCNIQLETLNLQLNGGFFVERCNSCLGIFFDTSELENFISESASGIIEIDNSRLNILLEERQKQNWPVAYVKCPVCQNFMNRKSYGSRSGVIIDQCKEHGIWLDGGELGSLLRWYKAGGLLHANNKKEEQARYLIQEAKAELEQINAQPSEERITQNELVRTIKTLFQI